MDHVGLLHLLSCFLMDYDYDVNIQQSQQYNLAFRQMKLSDLRKKRSSQLSNIFLVDSKMMPRKKNTELKQIHKTIVHDRVKTDYDTLYQKEKGSVAHPLSKKERSAEARARIRSKSQLSEYNLSAYDTIKRAGSPAEAPINIFISVEKLNKMKINNTKERSSRKSELYNIEYSNSRRKNSEEPDRQKSTASPHVTLSRRKPQEEQNPRDTLRQLLKKSSDNKRRFRTLDDEEAKEAKRSIEKKEKRAIDNPPVDNQKLRYQDLKHDYERFPAGFKKYKLLGRGGFSLVWMGFHKKSKKAYAVKQILTNNKYQTHLKQIWFSNYFFQNGRPRKQFESHPGVDNILIMYDYEIQELDTWIIYELCDGSLGGHLYDLFKDQSGESDYYIIKYKPLYQKMRDNPIHLKNLIVEIAKTLDLLEQHNIVHSDVKTENILIKQRKHQHGEQLSYTYKLIDYGSSFSFTNLKQYTLATPQYMCPELLNFILYQNKHDCNKQMLKLLKDYSNTSAIDIWGLGCIVLEIINGLPLWMTVDTMIQNSHKLKKGLFSVENRSFRRIIDKQLDVVNDLEGFFLRENHSGVMLDDQLKRVIKRMLDLNPSTRIRPRQILDEFGISIKYDRFLVEDM